MNAHANVLLVTSNFPPVHSGSATVNANLARFAKKGIIVLAPRRSYADGLPLIGWREFDRLAPFRVVRLPLLRVVTTTPQGLAARGLFLVKDILIRSRVAWSVLQLLVAERLRVVCVDDLPASLWILQLLSYVPGLRTLICVHGEEITKDDPYDRGFAQRRRALKLANRIVVVSRFSQRSVLDLLGEGEGNRAMLVENGVDTGRFRPAPRDLELVERYELAGQFVFITVCRLLERKGIDQALRAFAQLLLQHPNTRYLIVGSGPYESDLQALVGTLGIRHAVMFAGDVAERELAEHYRLGDVFVMPNRTLPNGDTEGFGLVFLEANSCGLPVIAGCDGGSPEAVRDGENGLMVDGTSVPAVHAAMLRLRADEALRTKLRQFGLTAAAASDWVNRADAFARVCSEP